jgi:hypothetical protein
MAERPPVHLLAKKPATTAPTPKTTNLVGGNLGPEFHRTAEDDARRAAGRAVTPTPGVSIEQALPKTATVAPAPAGSAGWVREHDSELAAWHGAYDASVSRIALQTLSSRWGRGVSPDEAATVREVGDAVAKIAATPTTRQSAATAADLAVPTAGAWRSNPSTAMWFPDVLAADPRALLEIISAGGVLSISSEKVPTYHDRRTVVSYDSQIEARRSEVNLRKAQHSTSASG